MFTFFIKINEWQNSVIIRNETSYNFRSFLKGNLLSKAFCCIRLLIVDSAMNFERAANGPFSEQQLASSARAGRRSCDVTGETALEV